VRDRVAAVRAGFFALFTCAALGCGGDKANDQTEGDDGGGDSGGAVDSGTVLPGCAGEPVVTWANFGQGFLREQCQACHASTVVNRGDAPADVIFDTEADAVRLAARIEARALGEPPSMPPEGGVSDTDRALLDLWLRCDPAMNGGGQ
jgi:hypothetical protein